jgi:hypothetical protein
VCLCINRLRAHSLFTSLQTPLARTPHAFTPSLGVLMIDSGRSEPRANRGIAVGRYAQRLPRHLRY